MTQIDIINNANERFNLFPRGFDSFNKTAAIIAQEFTILTDTRSALNNSELSKSTIRALLEHGDYTAPSRWALEYEEYAKSQGIEWDKGYRHLVEWIYNRIKLTP
jgi:hypothetical protein